MTKKSVKVGKELVQRTKNLNKNIETIMGKTAKFTEIFTAIDGEDGVTLTLSDSYSKNDLLRFYLFDKFNYDEFEMILDKTTVKQMAEFILKYLEK